MFFLNKINKNSFILKKHPFLMQMIITIRFGLFIFTKTKKYENRHP
jgi:hypothetical protein